VSLLLIIVVTVVVHVTFCVSDQTHESYMSVFVVVEPTHANRSGKKVAIFGVGDQESYNDNFCDAAGELFDLFQARGAKMEFGFTSQEGYSHSESKAVRGDKFCGLMCDEDNQYDLSEERAQKWVSQLKQEGFM
jgi:flavodoxin I